jgi:hypothetical protein
MYVKVPPTLRAIKEGAFFDCSGLMTRNFNNELEEIGAWAFHRCRSFVCIKIPPALRVIKEGAFFEGRGIL